VASLSLTDEPFLLNFLRTPPTPSRAQALLVDFDAFPRKFIELLELSRAQPMAADAPVTPTRPSPMAHLPSTTPGASLDHNRFVVRLETDGGLGGDGGHGTGGGHAQWAVAAAVLSVVETNPFKQLTHLALQLRPGNDASVKGYLASRLQQLLGRAARLDRDLSASQAALEEEGARRRGAEEALAGHRAAREAEAREARLAHAAELASRREDAAADREELVARLEGARQAAHAQLEESLGLARSRADEAEAKVASLTELKYAHEAGLRDLRAKCASLEGGASGQHAELVSLRAKLAEAEAGRFAAEADGAKKALTIAALEQQVADKASLARQAADLAGAGAEGRRHLEQDKARLEQLCGSLRAKLEETAAEVHKGNEAIARLQAEGRHLKDKGKAKSDVLKEQEKALAAERLRADGAERAAHASGLEQGRLNDACGRLSDELAEAKRKLAQSAELLDSNQQTISWLNKELNAAVGTVAFGGGLGASGGLGGTRGDDAGARAERSGAYGGLYGGGDYDAEPAQRSYASEAPPSSHAHDKGSAKGYEGQAYGDYRPATGDFEFQATSYMTTPLHGPLASKDKAKHVDLSAGLHGRATDAGVGLQAGRQGAAPINLATPPLPSSAQEGGFGQWECGAWDAAQAHTTGANRGGPRSATEDAPGFGYGAGAAGLSPAR